MRTQEEMRDELERLNQALDNMSGESRHVRVQVLRRLIASEVSAAVESEREECAKIASTEAYMSDCTKLVQGLTSDARRAHAAMGGIAIVIAAAIRARGEKEKQDGE